MLTVTGALREIIDCGNLISLKFVDMTEPIV